MSTLSTALSASTGFVFACLGVVGLAVAADPLDWPSWRGPEQNGVSREKGLVDSWSLEGDNLLWQMPEISTFSTPIVMNGKLYILCRSEPETTKEGEKVVCLDAKTGDVIWEKPFNVFLSDVPAERVGWSSCAGDPETGRVYAMGVCGYFQCLDGDTGETIWSHSLSEEFGLVSTYGGRTNVPVVFEDLVIISAVFTNWGETDKPIEAGLAFDPRTGGRKDMAKPAHRYLAMNKSTGEIVWFSGTRLLPEDTTYSTPMISVIDGQAVLVGGAGDGAVYALQPRTGKVLWKYQVSIHGLNVSPLVVDGKVYGGQSEENRDDNTMGALFAIDGTKAGDITQTGELWRIKETMVGRSSPLVLDDRVYAADDSCNFFVFDAATGEMIGKRQKLVGTIMRSSLLYADGKIYAVSTSGWHVLEPNDQGVKIVNRMRFPTGMECLGSPIVSHGRIYLPSTTGLFCIGTPDHEPAADPIPTPPQETPVGEDDKPALLQIVPAELLLRPGESRTFTARLFNERGQFLRETEATYAVDGPGQVDGEGRYTADSVPNHSASYVTAEAEGLTALARIRTVPELPWAFDFSDKQIPLTWVGARYRHQVRDLDGNPAAVKISTIPKGMRSQSWMGHPDMHDYTIQADLKGSIKDGKLPDMGVIAQRYTLDLMGASQQLQIRSWTPQLARFSKSVPFAWTPDTWYTAKFQASVEDGKAVLRGKVWEQGKPEPAEWTVEATDEAGNLVGSPGLFGNAGNAEIFIDNVSVTPNG